MRKLVTLWAAVFIAAHAFFLPPSLEDLDSISFALAVRGVDPPQAPVELVELPPPPHFIALARGATAILHAAGDPLNVPHALALVNVIGGALGLIALFALARALGFSTYRSVAASIVMGAAPLYWFTASRPLSDVAGLAAAIAAQALLARAWGTGHTASAIGGAAAAGAAMGVRLAAGALTLPLAIAVLCSRRIAARTRLMAAGALVGGVLTWLVPIAINPGLAASIREVPAIAERSRGGNALVEQLSAGAVRDALYATFVDPFGGLPIAAFVLGLALIGIVVAAVRERRALFVIALAFAPYAIFHLIFHDTNMARWALPVIPPIALLFVLPIDWVSRKAVLPLAAAAAAASLTIAVPALHDYASADSPGFAVLRDLHQLPRTGDTALAMHQRVAGELQQHQAWDSIPPMRTLPSTKDYEWLELVKLWQEGHEGPVWFIADPNRTDLQMIDPQRRHLMRQYAWPERTVRFLRGIRPDRLNWHFIQGPGWFLGRGWALSPEIGGLTARDRADSAPAVAWVRRRDIHATMLLGGRHLGTASDPPIVARVKIDGRIVDEWPINPGPFVFMRPILPEEIAGEGTFARLEIETSQEGSAHAPISLEQFDVQSIDGTLVAYDKGWWEPEYSERAGRGWRWTSGESTLWLFNPGRDLTLAISGEDPTRYYGEPIEMIVLAGDRELARWTIDDHFTRTAVIPAEALSVARGRITLRLSKTHVPGRLRFSPDQRELGIRIFDVSVH